MRRLDNPDTLSGRIDQAVKGPGLGDQDRGSRSALALVGLGFELVAPILVGLFAGKWADGRFGTGPWLVVTGAVLGIVVGFVGFVRRALPPREGGGDSKS